MQNSSINKSDNAKLTLSLCLIIAAGIGYYRQQCRRSIKPKVFAGDYSVGQTIIYDKYRVVTLDMFTP
jgi:uncharacterized membrane protein (UPF0136 family)